MEHRRKWYRRILVGFFLFMLAGTLISRIYDSMTVPKVLTVYAKRKSVETIITGTGTVKAGTTEFCGVDPGFKVESVSVTAGSEVKTGDELFRYQPESLRDRKQQLEEELEKARLELERLDISSESYPQVTQTELAERELSLARQELADGQEEHDEQWAEHFAAKKNLEEEYRKKKDMTDEEILLDHEQQLAAIKAELREARTTRETQLQEAQQLADDLSARLEAAKSGRKAPAASSANAEMPAGEDAASLEKQLADARRNLDNLKMKWRYTLDGLEARYDMLELQRERFLDGEATAQETLKENYLSQIQQEETAMQAEDEKLDALRKSVENAGWNLDIAARQDAYAGLTAGQQARLVQIDRKLKEISIADTEEELGRLEALIGEEGRVTASCDGTVILQEVTAGRTTTGEERLSIAAGSRIFEAEFDKEGQELAAGDLLTIAIPGSTRTVEARIGSMNLLEEETGTFQADLEDLNLAIGTVTSYQCRRTSDTYQQVIPLSALRRDSEGYYCLAVRARSAVMGQEFKAERVGLTVLEMGSTEAAVEGAIFDTDPLITASNQVIISGDRVRPVEDLQG